MKLNQIQDKIGSVAATLQSPLLLALRLFWGYQFVRTGWGKLTNLDRTAGYFESLHIPAAKLNALAAGSVECFGGALLLLGLWSRLASLPLIGTMAVAYLTAESDALRAITSDPDKFTSAAPFLFLLTCVIVLAFGPGFFSIDRLLTKSEK